MSSSGDPDAKEHEALVMLPFDQDEALAEAVAAFNDILDRHEAERATVAHVGRQARVKAVSA